jgi:hypothetical protein
VLTKSIFLLALLGTFSLLASGQELTARDYAKARGIPNRQTAITLGPPHACTLSKQHPCIYYGGDINASYPEEDGFSNENTLFIPQTYTYTEVRSPGITVSAAFSNNLSTYGILDPQTASLAVRSGVSEGNGGSLLCSGDSRATITDTHRNALGFEEYEVLTATPCTVPAGNIWGAAVPDCTNANDNNCAGSFWESDTNGPNAINGQLTVTSNTGVGPVLDSSYFGATFASWCNDFGLCGDGMSFGVLK